MREREHPGPGNEILNIPNPEIETSLLHCAYERMRIFGIEEDRHVDVAGQSRPSPLLDRLQERLERVTLHAQLML